MTRGAAELLAEAELLVRRLAGALTTTRSVTEVSSGCTPPAGLAGAIARWQYDYAQWLEWAISPAVNMKEGQMDKIKPPMDFGGALDVLKHGGHVARDGWNGKGQFVALATVNGLSDMGAPYLYLSPVDGLLVPWVPSQTDLLAGDWTIVKEPS